MTLEERIQLMHDDFKVFLKYVFTVFHRHEPTTMQYDMADFLQYEENIHKIIQTYREGGKSYVTAAYVCWRLFNEPNLRFLIVSATPRKAEEFANQVKRLIANVPLLKHLEPKKENMDRTAVASFDVAARTTYSQDPSVKCVGIFTNFTGSHADEVIADDVEVMNNCETQGQREKLVSHTSEFVAVAGDTGKITYLGTPHCMDSLYVYLKSVGFKRWIWPIMYPNDEQLQAYMGDLAPVLWEELRDKPQIIGRTTDPERFSDDKIASIRGSMPKSRFALQYMLDCSLNEMNKYPLKLNDLIVYHIGNVDKAPVLFYYGRTKPINDLETFGVGFQGDRFYYPTQVDEQLAPWEGIVMAIDPSGKGRDLTSYAIVGSLGGKLFLLKAGGFESGYSKETLRELVKVAKEWKVREIIHEPNFGDGMFESIFKPVMYVEGYECALTETPWAKGQKEKRIISVLEPVLNQHKLVVDYTFVEEDICAGCHSLMYQLAHLTQVRKCLEHDDMVDVLAMAIKYWVDSVGRDEELYKEQYNEEKANEYWNKLFEKEESNINFLGKPW